MRYNLVRLKINLIVVVTTTLCQLHGTKPGTISHVYEWQLLQQKLWLR